MSVIENIQKLFKTKSDQPGDGNAAASSATMGDSAVLPMSASGKVSALTGSDDIFSPGGMPAPEDNIRVSTELLSLPILGVRPRAEHQLILVVVLGFAVTSLAVVT